MNVKKEQNKKMRKDTTINRHTYTYTHIKKDRLNFSNNLSKKQ